MAVKTYRVLLHHGDITIDVVEPRRGDGICVGLLQSSEALVGAAQSDEAVAKLRVGLEIVAVGGHGTTQQGSRRAALLVLGVVTAASDPLVIDAHRLLQTLHA